MSVPPETEYIAALLAMGGIWLMVLRRRLGWWLNFASCLLYAFVFFSSKLYGDAGLQLFFAAMQLSGWIQWKRNRSTDGPALRKMTFDANWNTLLLTLGAALLIGYLLMNRTDSDVPWTDALCTAGSITGQWLQVARYRENWWYWILVNMIYIPLYLYKNLYFTAVMYAVFLGMALAGLMRWNKLLKE